MSATLPTALMTTSLPDVIHLQVGRLVCAFSAIEYSAQTIVTTLLRLSPVEARIAVRTPRISDSFEMIISLMALGKLTVSHDLKALSQELTELQGARDWFGHGVWSEENGVFSLFITSGSWQPPGFDLPPGKNSISRRIAPASAPISSEQIKQIADTAFELLPVVADVHVQLEAQMQP